MNRAVTTLLLVLLIQCAIVAAVYWPQQQLAQHNAPAALANFELAQVDEIRIADGMGNEATLVKRGERWLLPQLDNLPADPVKIEKLQAAISSTDLDLPIAHSSSARQRFQVANYHFQRRLDLLGSGQALGSVYLGTSPGFRKVHARGNGQDAIYSITYNVFDAAAAANSWLDPRLLQIRAPLAITADSYSLNRDSGSWLSGSSQVPEQRELDALLGALRTLQVDGTATAETTEKLAAADAELILQVRSLAGEVSLQLFTLGERHFIRSSEYALLFRLSAYDFDRLSGIDFALISAR